MPEYREVPVSASKDGKRKKHTRRVPVGRAETSPSVASDVATLDPIELPFRTFETTPDRPVQFPGGKVMVCEGAEVEFVGVDGGEIRVAPGGSVIVNLSGDNKTVIEVDGGEAHVTADGVELTHHVRLEADVKNGGTFVWKRT